MQRVYLCMDSERKHAFLQGSRPANQEAGFRALDELESKLLKGAYIGDYIYICK